MSRSYQYNYYNKNVGQKTQSPIQSKPLPSSQQMSQTIESLKQILKQKQSLLTELSKRLQQQQKLLEQKQFIIKQKQLELEYIHKENQQMHDKIFQLNQRLHSQKADIKETIKQEVGMLKQQFNFMIKESQIKNEIILQQKQNQFKRKQNDLKAVIKQLSERNSSHNGSFYYEQSHSNIIKAQKMPNSSFSKRTEDFFQNQQEKPSTANSNLRNSRDSYRSPQLDNKMLSSLRQSKAEQSKDKNLMSQQRGTSSVSNLMNLKQGGSSQTNSQVTGRFGSIKTPILSKLSVRRMGQNRQTLVRTSSKPNIDEIISRSKKQLDERNKKPIVSDIPKQYTTGSSISSSSNNKMIYRRAQNLDNSKIRYGMQQLDQKRKMQKLKQISSLKLKVNMLKTQLQQQITFCQHKE